MNYIKHLISRPLKLILVLAVSLFSILGTIYLYTDINQLLMDNPFWTLIAINIVLLGSGIAINIQAYKEYKDGNIN